MALGPLLRVARNVTSVARAGAFYRDALGFSIKLPSAADPELAKILGVESVKAACLMLGAQELELTECHPAGVPYPLDSKSSDRRFQHIAIVTTDIHRAHLQALEYGASAISLSGPVLLPAASGGAWAWKFRDPDGHPLELLQFPADSAWEGSALHLGYDHSAISVANAGRSVDFYTALGLRLRHRHLNQGAEQDRLDGLTPSVVEVVSLAASGAPPHVELLAYAEPDERAVSDPKPNDVAADRLVFGNATGLLALKRDPDGHFLLIEGRK